MIDIGPARKMTAAEVPNLAAAKGIALHLFARWRGRTDIRIGAGTARCVSFVNG